MFQMGSKLKHKPLYYSISNQYSISIPPANIRKLGKRYKSGTSVKNGLNESKSSWLYNPLEISTFRKLLDIDSSFYLVVYVSGFLLYQNILFMKVGFKSLRTFLVFLYIMIISLYCDGNFKGVFSNLSNVHDGAFWVNGEQLKAVHIFRKKAPS